MLLCMILCNAIIYESYEMLWCMNYMKYYIWIICLSDIYLCIAYIKCCICACNAGISRWVYLLISHDGGIAVQTPSSKLRSRVRIPSENSLSRGWKNTGCHKFPKTMKIKQRFKWIRSTKPYYDILIVAVLV